MPKNLVIVELPAKARTIERYLGSDYQVLASYGHVRDLPENPGKGKFGVDVDHDFAPDYVISEDRRKQVSAIEKAARTADAVYLATDLDREGEAIAWHVAEAAKVPAGKTHRVTFSEITEGAIKEAFASPAGHRPQPRGRAAGAPDRRPPRGLHAEPAHLAQGQAAACRRAACSRSPCGWSSSGSARSRAFVAREYWTLEAVLATRRRDPVRRRGRRASPASRSRSATATRRTRHVAALRGLKPVVDSVTTRPSKRNPSPPFTTSTLQQEASRKLGFSPKRTMGVAQRLYEGVDTPDGHVGLITYMRTDSTAIAGVAMAEAQAVIRRALRRALRRRGKGRVYKTKREGRPGGARVDPPDVVPARPGVAPGHARGATSSACTGSSGSARSRRQMAPKELETTTAELVGGRRTGCGPRATRTLFDGFAARLHRGPGRHAPRRRSARCRRSREGDVTSVVDVTPDPALHRAAAPLHRGDA